jgi:acyl-CoA synthetase (AMP-forming)/AMP-acid ligase II
MSVSPLRSLCDALNGDPDRLALGTLDSGEWVWKLTRAEATAQIEAVAGQLLSMGIREGDVVAITMTNTIEFVISVRALPGRLSGLSVP